MKMKLIPKTAMYRYLKSVAKELDEIKNYGSKTQIGKDFYEVAEKQVELFLKARFTRASSFARAGKKSKVTGEHLKFIDSVTKDMKTE